MRRIYFWKFVLLLALYVALAFTLPTDPQILERYNINQSGTRLLNLTVVGPLVAIYLTALYGFLRFNDYAKSIIHTKEGPHFNIIAKGLMVLTFSLPINSIIGSLFSYIRYTERDLLPLATTLRTYILLALAAIAIILIAKGTQGLVATLRRNNPINPNYALLGPIALASTFTWLITSHGPSVGADVKSYYLPQWLVIATVAIPYTYVWSVGIKAAYNLGLYKKSVKGTIYKRAFDNLAKGIGVIIFISIFIQFITTMTRQFSRLNLTPLLLIIYFLLVLYTVGFSYVARGAKKLKRIEEA